MPVNISKISRQLTFELETHALGTIRCDSLKMGTVSKIEKKLKPREVNSVFFARWLIQEVGRHIGKGENKENDNNKLETEGEHLIKEDIDRLSETEIQHFTREFVAHNQWLLWTYKDAQRTETTNEKGEKVISVRPADVNFPRNGSESHSDYLVRVLRHYLDEQAKKWKTLTKPLSVSLFKSAFSKTSEDLFKKHITLSNQLRRTLRNLDPDLRNPYVSGELEPRELNVTRMQLPENPAYGTNKRLDDVLEHAVELRPIMFQSAELFRSMSDTALQMHVDFSKSARQSLFASFVVICIATLSLSVTAWYSWWSYRYFSTQEDQYERIVDDQQAQIQSILERQDERYRQLLNDHTNHIEMIVEEQDPGDQRTIESFPPVDAVEFENDRQ